MTVVYTGGTFDLFHAGHVRFLKQCSKLGEVVVALNTDEFVESFKRKPIYDYKDRKEILESCKYVSKVVRNDSGADSKPTIAKVKPNIIAIGSDWCLKDYFKQMSFTREWLEFHEILLVYLDYTPGISTTDTIKNVLDFNSKQK